MRDRGRCGAGAGASPAAAVRGRCRHLPETPPARGAGARAGWSRAGGRGIPGNRRGAGGEAAAALDPRLAAGAALGPWQVNAVGGTRAPTADTHIPAPMARGGGFTTELPPRVPVSRRWSPATSCGRRRADAAQGRWTAQQSPGSGSAGDSRRARPLHGDARGTAPAGSQLRPARSPMPKVMVTKLESPETNLQRSPLSTYICFSGDQVGALASQGLKCKHHLGGPCHGQTWRTPEMHPWKLLHEPFQLSV